MSQAQDDIRATADSIVADTGRLAALEATKQRLEPGDRSLVTLSEQALKLATDVQRKAKAELELSEEIQAERE